MITILRSNPKKTVALLIALLTYLAYKKRETLLQFTFNHFLSRMNDKMMKQMQDKVVKTEKYNELLAKIQEVNQNYYGNALYQKKITQSFNQLKIDDLKQMIKNLDKSAPNYDQNRINLFQQLNQELLLFIIAIVVLFRSAENMLFQMEMIYLWKSNYLWSLIENDSKIIYKILEDLQILIIEEQFKQISQNINKFLKDSQSTKYDSKEDSAILIIQTLIQKLNGKINYKYVKEQSIQQLKERMHTISLEAKNQQQRLKIQQAEQCGKQLINYLIQINDSPAIKTFNKYSLNFSFQKLSNRVMIYEAKNQPIYGQLLMKQLTFIKKIEDEEFLSNIAIEQNDRFYSMQIKLAVKVQEGAEGTEFISNILHEFQLSELLRKSQIQMARKIVFQDDLNDDVSLEHNSMGF